VAFFFCSTPFGGVRLFLPSNIIHHFLLFVNPLFIFAISGRFGGLMLGKIFGALCGLSLVFGTLSKRLPEVASAIPDGAGKAIEVTLTLLGMMCLWSGVMQVLSDAGIIQKISRLFAPLLRYIFPKAYQTGEGYEEICATLSANFLGVGNAATPFALCAMKKMQAHNPTPEIADNEQITLVVLSTASLTLVPANLLALRRAAGSADPFCIMIPVWITSLLCVAFALLLTSFLRIRERFLRTRASKKR
jgi:spore maturation protein A